MSLSIEISFFCEVCGARLENNPARSDGPKGFAIDVVPCAHCLGPRAIGDRVNCDDCELNNWQTIVQLGRDPVLRRTCDHPYKARNQKEWFQIECDGFVPNEDQ